VVVGTVTVTVVVPVVSVGDVAAVVGLVVAGASVAVVVVGEVVVGDVVAAEADSMTPHATRLPESPVARVSSSGPAAPFFC